MKKRSSDEVELSKDVQKAIKKALGAQYHKKKKKNWPTRHFQLESCPGLVFFKATEPDSFEDDVGDNIVGGVVDTRKSKPVALLPEADKQGVCKLIGQVLAVGFPNSGDGLPPIEDMVRLVECLFVRTSCSIAKDQASVNDHWATANYFASEGLVGSVPQVSRSASGSIQVTYCYTRDGKYTTANKETVEFKV